MSDPSTATRLTFDELVTLEPRLAAVMADIRKVRDDGGASFCANAVWYGWGMPLRHKAYKDHVIRLVGWESKHPDRRLHTNTAYDTAYQTLYAELPNCRNCQCYGW